MDSTTTLDAHATKSRYYIETASDMQRQKWLRLFKTHRLPVKSGARWVGISKNGVETMTHVYDLDPSRLEPEQRARALAILTKNMSHTERKAYALDSLKIDAKTCRLCIAGEGESFA